MPQPFNGAVMTNAGARLLTRAQAGDITIEFTRMATGNGTYTEEDRSLSALQAMGGLKEEKNSYPISSIQIFSEHSVILTAVITNQDPSSSANLVDEGYYINEIGLYAKPKGTDEGEILYSIAVTAGEQGDFLPPYNGHSPAQITQRYFVTVDNSANVTIEYNVGAYATAEDIEALQRQLDDLSGLPEMINDQIAGKLGDLSRMVTDIAFQLALQELINTDGMEDLAVDTIDSAESIKIISGIFSENKVYI